MQEWHGLSFLFHLACSLRRRMHMTLRFALSVLRVYLAMRLDQVWLPAVMVRARSSPERDVVEGAKECAATVT